MSDNEKVKDYFARISNEELIKSMKELDLEIKNTKETLGIDMPSSMDMLTAAVQNGDIELCRYIKIIKEF